jgi:hypothetical protein
MQLELSDAERATLADQQSGVPPGERRVAVVVVSTVWLANGPMVCWQSSLG